MSFSEDIRASGNFQRQFGKEKRRVQLSEIAKTDIDSLQEHVVEMRTYAHFMDLINSVDNINDIQLGPNDYYFEPDYNEVKIRSNFMDVYGRNSTYTLDTVNGSNFYSLRMFDQATSDSSTGPIIRYSLNKFFVGDPEDIFDTSKLWKWKVGFHPPQVKRGNSISLNVDGTNGQMIYLSNLGTHFDYIANKISFGFWIYVTEFNVNAKQVVAYRYTDANNQWSIEIDNADNKLFIIFKIAGVSTKRQYDTALSLNTWYFVCFTWDSAGPTIVLKVNNNADTSSTKTTGTTATTANLYFGSYPGGASNQNFHGYITGLTYYKHATAVLTGTEMTNLYNNNTKSATPIKPFIWGIGQYG